MLLSMVEYDDDDQIIRSSLIPFVDGGTEGFKGFFILEKRDECCKNDRKGFTVSRPNSLVFDLVLTKRLFALCLLGQGWMRIRKG